MANESKALALVKSILNQGINGVPPILPSATAFADSFMDYDCWKNINCKENVVRKMIKRRCFENFLTGTVTSLGGVITLPVNIIASLGASWVIQANLAAAIAYVYEHDLRDDHIRTAVLLSILGDSAAQVLKKAGVKITEKALYKAISKIPGKVLIEINKKVGFRLLTKAGEKGVINLVRGIPIAGAIVGGTVDAVICNQVGKMANKLFHP